ncbi:mRNA cleavage and polyadenylation factor subunit, variant 2 [Aspergillus wentii]
MQCYTELLPPTGVTHALNVPFISATANNLVIVRTSLLQIFSLLTITSRPDGGITENRLTSPDQLEITKLVLEREYTLPGTVSGLSRVKVLNTKCGGEAILLAFRNAKLSLIEWDQERHSISTISIHYYERDDLTRSPWVPDLSSCGSILSVDPSSRCAVFNFGIRNLAILPFHQPGDDLVMDDYDSDHGDKHADQVADMEKTKDGTAHQTPYASSFVLPLTALDPSLLHPISLAFLYEYREPTFGILYSQVATSNALLHERRDVVFYAVFTLDLEQRASTTLLSVSRLPSDLFKVVALPPPVGGALLIGSNELVHVDQAGKTNAVGVNEFSRQVSTFSMSDQSDLGLRLEGCVVERLGDNNGDLLLVLSTGHMVLVDFKLDGRSVSGISVHSLPANAGGNIMKSAASCSAFLGNGRIFFGSEDTDSVLLDCPSSPSNTRKSRSQTKHIGDDHSDLSDEDQTEDDAYEDDLYSTASEMPTGGHRSSTETSTLRLYSFRVNDTLSNIGPLRDIALGNSFASIASQKPHLEDTSVSLELVASQGSDTSGGLVVMKREIDPHVITSMKVDSVDCVWATSVVHGKGALSNVSEQKEKEECRQYVIASKLKHMDREESEVFLVDGQTLKPFKAPEFNPNEDFTIDVGTLAGRSRVVQVLKNEVRSYDSELGLAQIYPVWDEDTSDERMAVAASFVDPYLAILRDDSTLLLLQADEKGDLDEVVLSEDISTKKWLSSCVYYDHNGCFSMVDPASEKSSRRTVLLFLLSSDCRLFMFELPDQKLLSVIEGVDCLQPILSNEQPKRSATREILTEAIIANLGDSWSSSPYLIFRTESDDLVVYKPFLTRAGNGGFISFLRETNHHLPRVSSNISETRSREQRTKPLRILPNISGLSTVFMPGNSASFIFKTSTSSPHVIRLRGEPVQGLSGLDSAGLGCDRGFVYVDSKEIIRICQLPHGTQFGYPWTLRKVHIGEQIDHLTYSSSSETYVLGTSYKEDFKLPEDDELHPEWRSEVISFLPEVDQSSLKIVSPRTWSIIDSYPLGPAEHVMALKNINLEVSENTHERRDMIVVGTSFARGEDIPSRGCVYVFEVIKVVPDPEKPETDRKLKLMGKELVRGAVTALSGIGGQGFLVVAQGQKCMVRGLKEDGSLLPVAFMDMQCYVNVVKELKGTGLCIFGDAVKGLWFAGYSVIKSTLPNPIIHSTTIHLTAFVPRRNRIK